MSHSPYKHMSARDTQRLDLILLDGLSRCKEPASTDAVIQISDPRDFAKIESNDAVYVLTLMVAAGYAEQTGKNSNALRWVITEKGRAHLIASETRSVIEEVARHTPIRTESVRAGSVTDKPRIEEATEMDLNARLRASHDELDRNGVPRLPAVATVCLNEDELDDWWTSLDTTSRAVAFTEYSLRNAGPTTSGVEIRVPVIGTAGEMVGEWAAMPARVNRQQHECVTGGD
jgi:hypothetical protein